MNPEDAELAAGQLAAMLVMNTNWLYPVLYAAARRHPAAVTLMTELLCVLDDHLNAEERAETPGVNP